MNISLCGAPSALKGSVEKMPCYGPEAWSDRIYDGAMEDCPTLNLTTLGKLFPLRHMDIGCLPKQGDLPISI
jgi:hypothetical protein